jgi:hypothetical protein
MGMNTQRRSGWAVAVIVLILLAPILYFLSTGPVVWLEAKGVITTDSPAMGFIYWPVSYGVEHSPHFEWVLVRYLALWHPGLRTQLQVQPVY